MGFDPEVLEYVFKLKKTRVRGRNLMSSCPFAETQHEDGKDKHQSFGINLDTGFWHCMTGDTLILCKEGYKEISSVTTQDHVIDTDGRYQKVKKVFSRLAVKGELLTLKMEGLDEPLTITGGHEILVIRLARCPKKQQRFCREGCTQASGGRRNCSTQLFKSYKEEWVKASEVVGVPFAMKSVRLTDFGNGVSDDLAWLLGYYCAEGSTDGTRVSFASSLKEREYIEPKLDRVMSQVFEKCSKQKNVVRSGWGGISYRYSVGTGISVFDCVGHSALTKTIPFHLLSKANVASFIEGYHLGDGHTCRQHLAITTGSRGLAYQTRMALLAMGRNAVVKKRRNINRFSKKPMYQVLWHNTWDKVGKFIGEDFWVNASLKSTRKTGRVYDLEVEGSHTYNANGVVVHNCFSCQAKGRTLRSLAHEMKVMMPDDLMRESLLVAPPNKDALNKYNLRTQVKLTDDFLRADDAHSELGKRGISLDVLKTHKVGYDDKGSILFPCIDTARHVHGWVARNKSWDGRYGFGPAGIKRCFLLFGLEKPAKKILLVESMTDCLKLMTWGEPAVSTCGNMVFPEQAVILTEAGVEEVILVPQNDLPARKWIFDAKENLRGKFRVSGIAIDKEYKDVGSDGYTKKMWEADKKKIRFLY